MNASGAQPEKTRVGIAFQGGGFAAGAIAAGTVKTLVNRGAFQKYDITAFSGTSAGALVASACWANRLKSLVEKTDTIQDLPKVLEDQWMHFALGIIPNEKTAQAVQLVDSLGRMNPAYDYVAQNMLVPILRAMMVQWVREYIPIDDCMKWIDDLKRQRGDRAFEHDADIPRLALGSAEIRTGEVKVFKTDDFCLEAVLASGSLDEANGMTEIESGPNAGIYLDGAWGDNPPLTPMMDYGVDEIWIVEVFPKQRPSIPKSHEERKDRKDELWQNSLVEHEIKMIEFINDLVDIVKRENIILPDILKNSKRSGTPYRHIAVQRLPMLLDLAPGAAFVNSPSFIRKLMDYGESNAATFMINREKDEQAAKKAA